MSRHYFSVQFSIPNRAHHHRGFGKGIPRSDRVLPPCPISVFHESCSMFHVARPTFQIEGKLGDREEESPLGVINTCTEIRDIFLISEVIGDKDWNDERDAYRGGWRNRFIPLLKMINWVTSKVFRYSYSVWTANRPHQFRNWDPLSFRREKGSLLGRVVKHPLFFSPKNSCSFSSTFPPFVFPRKKNPEHFWIRVTELFLLPI